MSYKQQKEEEVRAARMFMAIIGLHYEIEKSEKPDIYYYENDEKIGLELTTYWPDLESIDAGSKRAETAANWTRVRERYYSDDFSHLWLEDKHLLIKPRDHYYPSEKLTDPFLEEVVAFAGKNPTNDTAGWYGDFDGFPLIEKYVERIHIMESRIRLPLLDITLLTAGVTGVKPEELIVSILKKLEVVDDYDKTCSILMLLIYDTIHCPVGHLPPIRKHFKEDKNLKMLLKGSRFDQVYLLSSATQTVLEIYPSAGKIFDMRAVDYSTL